MLISDKHGPVKGDVTAPVHTDLIEQQCETSSPTDYFTTSCCPPVLPLHLFTSQSWHQYSLLLSVSHYRYQETF